MRIRLADLLTECALADPRLYILSGDHGYALFDPLRKACPGQFINSGVAEQSMVGIAAGMAKSGLRPVVYGLSAFIPIRVLEFIKMDVCYEALPVIFLGDGAGLVYSTLGSSHQCAEDIAVLHPLPSIKIYSPADAIELEYSFRQAMADTRNASYIRLGKSDKVRIHENGTILQLEKGCVRVRDSDGRAVIFATGSMVSTAMDIAEKIDASVISVICLSEIDGDIVKQYVDKHEMVFTIEEHSVIGGLGSIVDSFLVEKMLVKKVHHFGIQRYFTTIASSYENALQEHGLSTEQLLSKMQAML